jgi:carboxymethylenebutenolidase
MCDETDLSRFDAALARRGLNRRQFAAMGAAVLVWACSSGKPEAAEPDTAGASASDIGETMVSIDTPDGKADAFFVHPASGRYPGVLLWPDIGGLREAFKMMARRLAAQGYAVLAVNPYYRGAQSPVLQSFSEWMTPEGKARIQPLREALTADAITRDAKAYVAWLDRQDAVDRTARIGTMGFCMGGPFTIRTAAAVPARIGAAASLHGAGLVGEGADSPHRLLGQTQAAYLFAIARNDDAKEPGVKDALRQAAEKARRPAEIEVYPADHGWTVPDSPVYDKAAAERAWERLSALFSQRLKTKAG